MVVHALIMALIDQIFSLSQRSTNPRHLGTHRAAIGAGRHQKESPTVCRRLSLRARSAEPKAKTR